MKSLIVFFIIVNSLCLFAQSRLYIWKGNVKVDSADVTNDLKITFKTVNFRCEEDSVIYEGQAYPTVKIGTQCWLKENLNVGNKINGIQNPANNNIIEKYCYNDADSSCALYGAFYAWNEAMQYSSVPASQGICPSGWHIPTIGDFEELIISSGNSGNALKAVGQGSGSGAGTNTTGFSALLTGYKTANGVFNYFGVYGIYWTSTENNISNATYFTLNSSNNEIYFFNNTKSLGYNVRCVLDRF